jgi:hypothetical protein
MDELIRGKLHEALDVEQPADDLRARVLASLPVEQRSVRRFQARSLQLAGGLVAAFLAVALVAALLYSRGSISPHPAQGGQCQYLYSPGSGGNPQMEAIVVINESTSTSCTLKTPAVSFIDAAGNRLDVPQDWAPGASEGGLSLGPLGAAAIPYTVEPSRCSGTSLDYVYMRASFAAGVEVRVPGAGNVCTGMRIVVSAPTPAVTCADGSFAWASPNTSGPKPTC